MVLEVLKNRQSGTKNQIGTKTWTRNKNGKTRGRNIQQHTEKQAADSTEKSNVWFFKSSNYGTDQLIQER